MLTLAVAFMLRGSVSMVFLEISMKMILSSGIVDDPSVNVSVAFGVGVAVAVVLPAP
jgi:hypothetical protein